jgi:hypothetical protein
MHHQIGAPTGDRRAHDAAVYADVYTPELDGYLQQDQIVNAIIFPHSNNGRVRPRS